jgi:hypothetical protein
MCSLSLEDSPIYQRAIHIAPFAISLLMEEAAASSPPDVSPTDMKEIKFFSK